MTGGILSKKFLLMLINTQKRHVKLHCTDAFVLL